MPTESPSLPAGKPSRTSSAAQQGLNPGALATPARRGLSRVGGSHAPMVDLQQPGGERISRSAPPKVTGGDAHRLGGITG